MGQQAEIEKKKKKKKRQDKKRNGSRQTNKTEVVKWNQMTALRFSVSDIRHPALSHGRAL